MKKIFGQLTIKHSAWISILSISSEISAIQSIFGWLQMSIFQNHGASEQILLCSILTIIFTPNLKTMGGKIIIIIIIIREEALNWAKLIAFVTGGTRLYSLRAQFSPILLLYYFWCNKKIYREALKGKKLVSLITGGTQLYSLRAQIPSFSSYFDDKVS